MLKIGCHLSIAKGFYKAGVDALHIGANTFQYFTRNPRGGKAKELDEKDLDKFFRLYQENDFAPLFAHAPYTMNLCSDKPEVREFALGVLQDDLERLRRLPPSYYVFHPGSHVGQGAERAMEYIIDALNQSIKKDNEVPILLEGMSGKGSEVGGRLEELKQIIQGVKNPDKLGILVDSCHLYSAGYDVVGDLDGVVRQIDEIIGLDRLKGIHLNDSKVDFASHKDRHEVLGEGTIGKEAIVGMINHPKLRNLVFNLETPNELEGYKEEIAYLREHYKEGS